MVSYSCLQFGPAFLLLLLCTYACTVPYHTVSYCTIVCKETSQCLAVLINTKLTDATLAVHCHLRMLLCRSSCCSWCTPTLPESGRIRRQITPQTRVLLPWSMVSRALRAIPSSSWMGPGSCCGLVCFFGQSLRLL